jgi:hypothetical protein
MLSVIGDLLDPEYAASPKNQETLHIQLDKLLPRGRAARQVSENGHLDRVLGRSTVAP